MTDLKHYGHPRRRASDRVLDGFFTGVAVIVAISLLIFYGLGATL